ncbi:hypothetical protein H8356DRAFT_1739845 [Neocallimastix lanati (nom. inval.)]|jgi:hypothetical protein|uniref:Ubiquitin-like domain-containing protein n=1 Tax=Neocallimastix californiae TaxID=1754190 RepID=A0A1Y2DBU4_9FUNG|nr:hypothetical protein H8356DRAFT_1739845 [Neocallimastix sp. JGI-2020a]ORY56729.1 hypothetical protein LY90DRAFT_455017 [Neocallimastix californiae]|eukprot:ORY56729.1 hypothetical protein LY90DRAFT_455017 [Neocallimastix californiae]
MDTDNAEATNKDELVEAGEEVENKETSSNHGVVINEEVPSDKVNVRLLRPNGTRTDVLLESSDTILNLKQQILDTWPKEWTDEVPTTINNIKILHYGKYLEDESTLEANKLPVGQTTIVHLIIKFSKKELDEKDKEDDVKPANASCCCIIS